MTKQLIQHPAGDKCQSTQGPKIHVILTTCPDKTIMDLANAKSKGNSALEMFSIPLPKRLLCSNPKTHVPSEDRPPFHQVVSTAKSSLVFQHLRVISFQFTSVTQLCPTLCEPMDCSTSSFPVLHQFPELAQTHVD